MFKQREQSSPLIFKDCSRDADLSPVSTCWVDITFPSLNKHHRHSIQGTEVSPLPSKIRKREALEKGHPAVQSHSLRGVQCHSWISDVNEPFRTAHLNKNHSRPTSSSLFGRAADCAVICLLSPPHHIPLWFSKICETNIVCYLHLCVIRYSAVSFSLWSHELWSHELQPARPLLCPWNSYLDILGKDRKNMHLFASSILSVPGKTKTVRRN